MSLERFRACLPRVLSHEGGYVDHPADPGGATNLGVTLATARTYKLDMDGDGDVDKADVKRLTPDSVGPIYHRGYWLASSADICPPGLDYIVFDCAVNQGVGRAVRWLQQVAGVAPDGVIGPKSKAAIAALDPAKAIKAYAALREAHYRSLSTFKTFGKGWMRRLLDVSVHALTEA